MMDPHSAAFPYFHPWNGGERTEADYGLTKREIFAMEAMKGLVANPQNAMTQASQIANWAIEQADALIEALNQPKS